MRLSILATDKPLSHENWSAGSDTGLAPMRWLDFSRSVNVKMTTGPHGYEALSGFYPARPKVADTLFLATAVPTIYLNAGAGVIWKGRLEDVKTTRYGLEWSAFGPFRYFSDKLYTALWSSQDISGLVPVARENGALFLPHFYIMDNNERVFIALEKNTTYGYGTEWGAMAYRAPHNRSTAYVKRVEYSYDVDLPTDFVAEVVSCAEGFASQTLHHQITTSGTGTHTISLTTARPIIFFRVRNLSGSSYNYTGENAAKYAKWYNVRFKGADSSTIAASDVVSGILTAARAINASRLSSSTVLIESTTQDLKELVFEDVRADDALRDLAATTDAAAEPSQYEVGMWGDFLHFRQKGKNSRVWYADVNAQEYERTITALANSVYGISRTGANLRALRTGAVTDADSVAKYGITREEYVQQNTTDSAEAEDYRDQLIANLKEPALRAAIDIERVTLAEGGGAVPPWMVRAGDKLVVRDAIHLPGIIGSDLVVITIARTELDVDNMRLSILPESLSTSLPVAVARRPVRVGADLRYMMTQKRPGF